jgi:hypothetical protein
MSDIAAEGPSYAASSNHSKTIRNLALAKLLSTSQVPRPMAHRVMILHMASFLQQPQCCQICNDSFGLAFGAAKLVDVDIEIVSVDDA